MRGVSVQRRRRRCGLFPRPLQGVAHQLLNRRSGFRIEALQLLIQFNGDGIHVHNVFGNGKFAKRLFRLQLREQDHGADALLLGIPRNRGTQRIIEDVVSQRDEEIVTVFFAAELFA